MIRPKSSLVARCGGRGRAGFSSRYRVAQPSVRAPRGPAALAVGGIGAGDQRVMVSFVGVVS